jgi:hypothetical protein
MENNNQTITDFNSALSLINSLSDIFKLEIWIPSIRKNIIFKEMEARQQKQLLSVAMENSIYNNLFSEVFYNILKTNLIETEDFKLSDLDNLTIFDKTSIAIFLRNQISNKLKVIFDENKKISNYIDLTEICEKLKTFQYEDEKIVELKSDKITIKTLLTVPTIKEELDYDLEITKIFKKTNDIKTDDDIKNIITEAFITETTKYINKLYIEDQEINFKDLTLKQKIQIVEKIPSGLIQQILEIVSSWKLNIDDILTVKYEKYESIIKIDSILFLN